MPQIESGKGKLMSVNTDTKIIRIDPGGAYADQADYKYDLPDYSDDDFMNLVGKGVEFVLVGGIIKRLRASP